MGNHDKADESMLIQLFEGFVDAGLHGRFEEALGLIDEPYAGVGMGEQGIVRNKEQAELVLRGGYRPTEENLIEYSVTNLTVSFVNDDAAVVMGQVDITNTPKGGKPMHSGLMQTVGARRRESGWGIAFTHASPSVLTVESVEAYPIRFMDHTISLIKAGLQAETILYAEINLTQNEVVRLEAKGREWLQKPKAHTMEEVIRCALYGKLDVSTEQEYYAFWNRLRLMGLFAEGVIKDHFDYRMLTEQGYIWLRSAVEMVRQAYSGDVMAVISYSSMDNQKMELEQYTHKAFHDALTGVLNRDGFEKRAVELLEDYDSQNNTALLMIDLDDFKQINDRLGHQMGDVVLHQVASVLQDEFYGSAAVGRWGGDEFMILMTGKFTSTTLKQKAEELLNSMKLCIDGSKQISVSVSIGIAYGRARITFEKLYRIADIALYTAKKAGKCCYHLINSDTNFEQSYSGLGSNLLSLQTLLDYTDGKDIIQRKTPYEALIENIPGSVLVISLSDRMRLTHCNDWTSRFTGYSSEEIEELQKDDALALTHPDDLEPMHEMLKQMYAGLEKVHFVYRLRRKDGTYRHVQINVSMTERTKNEIVYHGIETDVEEMIKIQGELEYTSKQLEALLTAIPGGIAIFEITDTLKVTQYGNWFCRFTGYDSEAESEQARQGKEFATVWPEDVPRTQEALRHVSEDGVDNVFISVRVKCKSGAPKWVDIRGSVIERSPDKITMYVIYTEPAGTRLD